MDGHRPLAEVGGPCRAVVRSGREPAAQQVLAHLGALATVGLGLAEQLHQLLVARALGVNPEACLMVGDDAFNDLSARTIGMSTYYVGPPMGSLKVGTSGALSDLFELWTVR